LLVEAGIVVDVIAIPEVSSTALAVNVNDAAVKSAETSPDCTVYVPVNVLPAEAAVNTTVLSTVPVSNVTVMVLPDRIGSLVVAEILIAPPTPYKPSDVDEEKAVIVGAMVS
jgi:hypothetical protein